MDGRNFERLNFWQFRYLKIFQKILPANSRIELSEIIWTFDGLKWCCDFWLYDNNTSSDAKSLNDLSW